MAQTPFSVSLQHYLPKYAITKFAGFVAGWRGGIFTTAIIRRFVAKYQVNMTEAVQPDISAYATFNDFFTRPLKPSARPLAEADFVCPVDGAISQFGKIEGDQIFQAKGHRYSTTALLGGDVALAAAFQGGQFATLYLSPRDYHRIHMPCAGTLRRMIYVPGEFYSVNPATAENVARLFARNERVICVFESSTFGAFAIVLVGATIVGSMATVWHGVVNPPRLGAIKSWNYAGAGDKPIRLEKGEELGRFLLGSTIVALFPQNVLTFNEAWAPAGAIAMGSAMASRAR